MSRGAVKRVRRESLVQGDTIGLTQAECAARLGVSTARVSFLERRAMMKLRAAAKERGLCLDDALRDWSGPPAQAAERARTW